jgi:hypothetical protein
MSQKNVVAAAANGSVNHISRRDGLKKGRPPRRAVDSRGAGQHRAGEVSHVGPQT